MTQEAPARGRLFLVAAPSEEQAAPVALELGSRLPHAFVVSASQIGSMVVGRRAGLPDNDVERLRGLLLRWSACLAAAETFLLEGFDAVVHDAITGDQLEDFLDLCAPEPVHVVVVDEPHGSDTPRWGLWLDPAEAPAAAASAVLSRLEDSRVLTGADPAEPPP